MLRLDLGRSEIQIELQDELFRIGDPPKADAEFFSGGIVAMILDGGESVIADRRSRELLFVGAAGRVSRLTRQGAGPGEITFPSAVMELDSSRFAVLDNALRRLLTYRVTEAGPAWKSQTPFDTQPSAICSVDSLFVALNYSVDSPDILTVFRADGARMSSFGKPFISGSRLAMLLQTTGTLICLDDPLRVILATSTGEIMSYGLDGTLNWRLRIPDFEPGAMHVRGNAARYELLPDGGERSRLPTSFTAISPHVGVVQLQEYLADPSEKPIGARRGRILTKLFDFDTGALLGEQEDLPRILAIKNGLVLLEHGESKLWLSMQRFSVAILAECRAKPCSSR